MADSGDAVARARARVIAQGFALLTLVAALVFIFVKPSWLPIAEKRTNAVEGRTVTQTTEKTITPDLTTTVHSRETSSGTSPSEKTTDQTTTVAGSTIAKSTTATVDAPPDTGVWGRAFATPGVATLFQIGVAVLAAFLVGAAAQRITLGAYGVKVGPVEIPELPPVTAQEVKKATDTITKSPTVGPMLEAEARHPQPFPQFMFIDDERLAMISIRLEVEEQLRKLAQAMGIDRELSLDKILTRLVQQQAIDENAAKGLRDLIAVGDRVAAGAKVRPRASSAIRDEGLSVIYALQELTGKAERRELGTPQ